MDYGPTVSRAVSFWRDFWIPLGLGVAGLVSLIFVIVLVAKTTADSERRHLWWPTLYGCLVALAGAFLLQLLARWWYGPPRSGGPDSGWVNIGLVLPVLGAIASRIVVLPAVLLSLPVFCFFAPANYSRSRRRRVVVGTVAYAVAVGAMSLYLMNEIRADGIQRFEARKKSRAAAAIVQEARNIAGWAGNEKQLAKDEARLAERRQFLIARGDELDPETIHRWEEGFTKSEKSFRKRREMLERVRMKYNVTGTWEEAAEAFLRSKNHDQMP